MSLPWRKTPLVFGNITHYTIHGLKSTFLSWASQLKLDPESRRLQGHHKDPLKSTRLYSRDDIDGSIFVQETIIQKIQEGWRPHTPLSRGGQLPLQEPQVILESPEKNPLQIAAALGHLDIVRCLAEAAADIHLAQHGLSPLYVAADNGNCDAVRYLHELNGNIHQEIPCGSTPILGAGNLDTVRYLTTARANINQTQRCFGGTPLWLAAWKGKTDIVSYLLDMRAQARVLTLDEVKRMEFFMTEKHDLNDKYIMGCCLFALYSRSRWSDLYIYMLDDLDLDVCNTNEGPFGYVESSTRFQKTGNTATKRRLSMPLVAPIEGVTDVGWALIWFEVLDAVGFRHDASPVGALCRPPAGEGFLRRSVTSTEIGDFMNLVLGLEGHDVFSSHSLKSTTLSWAAKYGLSEPTRTLLGHHELGSKSLTCYSRDMLARPLAEYQSMLMNIKGGHFKPDLSRSGWMASKQGIDVLEEAWAITSSSLRVCFPRASCGWGRAI